VSRTCVVGCLTGATLLLAGCGSKEDSLHPASPQARDLASLWWWMMGGAWIGFGVIAGLLWLAYARRRRRGLPGGAEQDRGSWIVVVGLGIAVPIVVITTLFVVSDIFVIRTTQAPAASKTRMTIQVIGRQWFWEVRYPGSRAVTANEIHIPVRTPVELEVRTADVIHSFWVPQLNRKIDAVPELTNRILLYADRVGRYRGQCAEFCGLQHAHMGVWVFAEPAANFRRWLANESKPARQPAAALARRGERLFVDGPCSSCHTIRGIDARGYVGPDLTHLESRASLGALTVPNTRARLAQWLVDSQHVKPGNQMPNTPLGKAQLAALLAYLEGLR
jgi:cytochrome c oxidase subunit II